MQHQVERVAQKVLARVVEEGCVVEEGGVVEEESEPGVSWAHIIVGSWPNDSAIKKEVVYIILV